MIYTFYSYKGGVGRTMALANIAELFYQAGLNVLMIDWDLEAPGLERFFPSLDLEKTLDKLGLMDMLVHYKEQMAQEVAEGSKLKLESPEKYVIDVYPDRPDSNKLFLLTAGRRSKPDLADYARAVLTFDWQDFYKTWGGELYFNWLREEFEAIADVILIDSRTGITEMGGVCTYHLADTVIMFCGPNPQNLEGTYDMAMKFTAPDVQKLRTERPLNVLVIPARIENAESDSLNEFQKEFEKLFAKDQLKSAGINGQEIWQLAIPYVPRYAYKETVAAREKDKASAKEMVEVFVRLLGYLSLQAPEHGRIRQLIKESTTSIEGSIVKSIRIQGDVNQQVIVTSGGSYIQEVMQTVKVPVDPQTLRTAYLKHLLDTCNSLSLVGVDPKAASDEAKVRLSLGAVYTALLTLEPENHERLLHGELLERGSRHLSALAKLDRHARLVILGDPGSGKSTFVNFVAVCLAGEVLGNAQVNLARLIAPLSDDKGQAETEAQPWSHGAMLPVRVILRDFAARALPAPGQRGSAKHLWDFIVSELDAANLGDYAPHLQWTLQMEGGLLLLDGLDEVPEAQQRRVQLKQVVEDFAAAYPRCRLLVTSRTYSYQQQAWRLPSFAETVLAPFSQGQIRRFVDNWYTHIAELRGLHRNDVRGRAELLKRAIFSSDRLYSLAERPLLLTLMISLHAWRGGSLPENREEMYADTVDLLLDWWESPKTVRNVQGQSGVLQPSLAEWLKVDREKVRALLNELAYQAHADQPELVGTADVAEGKLVSGLMRLSQNPEVNPALLVHYLSQRAGLILPRGVEVYTFPHRTVQEYLAACYLTDQDYPDRVAELARSEPARWREICLLAGAKAARGSASSIWQLAEALCFRDPRPAGPLADLWGALVAGQALAETANLSQVSERNQTKLDRVRRWLISIVQGDTLPPTERAAGGVSLAYLHDPRPGIGLRSDGLPDIEWCEVPAGPFLMGSDEVKDPHTRYDEMPQHRVDLPAYKISRYPITNAQYQAFVVDGGYQNSHFWSQAAAGAPWRSENYALADFGTPFNLVNHPVVGVNWYEAMAFCRWLTERLHQAGTLGSDEIITLPSERLWEKAARGTEGKIYPWGDELDSNRVNYSDTGIGITSAVGCFPGGNSSYACEDMSGNVWEWTCSLYKKYPYSSEDRRENLNDQGNRVIRGGSYQDDLGLIRCSTRRQHPPDQTSPTIGFRVVVCLSRVLD